MRGGGRALDWAPAVDVAPGVTELAWRARSAERGGGAVAIEEHYLDGDSPLLSQTFQKQAYAYWRFALNGDVQTGPSVEATTRVYATRAAFFAALERKRLNAGALVFLDVLYEGLDTAYDRAALADTHVLDHGDLPESACGAKDPATDLDYVCAYQHTPGVAGSLLRAVRLRDAPGRRGPARRLWWPEGLEGLDDPARDRGPQHGPRGFAADARALTAAPAAGLEARPFLFDCGLTGLARAAGRRARFSSSATGTAPEPTTYGFDTGAGDAAGGDGAAVFALAPAGDTWSSGRVVEALLRGAIPVVDATYASDGHGALCFDAACAPPDVKRFTCGPRAS
ncbi:hypothetical protein JL720_1215 [Aureococcus anophagefferens]|nr:hypothetical protein JL720_1215 [Aureococcus anophagefferens]